MMDVIMGTGFTLTLGVWRLRIGISIEDTASEGNLARVQAKIAQPSDAATVI